MSRRAYRLWMAANTLVLVAMAAWILKPNATGAGALDALPGSPAPALAPLLRTPAPAQVPTRASLLATPGQRFGLSAPDVPWAPTAVDRLAASAGARPTMLQYFVKWTEDFRPEAVALSYQQGALPVLSWEPWAGIQYGTSQPRYALARIINGAFDQYLLRFATAVRDQRWPVAIRFAHEMNGHWYPWSERRSGNEKGEYVRAWRHVHDVFTAAGANNVIWVWSPNILRPVPAVSLRELYPGDSYVDWIGMIGYAVRESTAAMVFEPTLAALRAFSAKPVVITETGVQPSPRKARWIADFFGWLPRHPEVIGFIWFEYDEEQGGNQDWRFTATPASTKAFNDGLNHLKLANSL